MNFSENLKNIRSDAGITQESLSEKIGVTSVTIGNWERGVRKPSFELLPKLADALGTTIDDLLVEQSVSKTICAEDKLLIKYRMLDAHGRRLVNAICDMELERQKPRNFEIAYIFERVLEARDKKHTDIKHNRYIPFYSTPSAAGISVPLEGNEFEMLLADGSVPIDADYAVRISGDSMEPYIQDGEMVFIKETQELYDGDVGIFCVNGTMYCKQYHIDEERNLYLLSANPDRIDANIYIDGESGSSVKCCGKVLLGKAIPLPNYFSEEH